MQLGCGSATLHGSKLPSDSECHLFGGGTSYQLLQRNRGPRIKLHWHPDSWLRKKKKNLISWKKNHLPNCHVSGSQLLSITITFCLSRKNAFHSERDLFIRENNRDKSINVWVFINSGIKPFGITCEATSYRSQWGKASYTLVKGTFSIHFCLTLEHNKIQIPNLGWISIIQPPVSHNSSSCSGWVVVETKKWCTGTWFSDLTNYVIGYMLSSILRLFF